MSTLHVEPRNGSWIVRPEGAHDALSEHPDAGQATLAACARARRSPSTHVLVHDRYHRVRPAVSRRAPGRR